MCKRNVEDEIHFMLECDRLQHLREPFLKDIFSRFKNLESCTSKELFIWLLSCEDASIQVSLSKFIENMLNERENISRLV